ncbi:hypothetical protein JTB14_006491 [Gonioctena quinquepunctata]|nr:hypothetical protein JTB14_006491 [Gonioctena quinquepunctata]
MKEVSEFLRQTKQELKSLIEAVEVRITLKVEEINRRLNKLEKENKLIQERTENIERKIKENNIVIFGLKHPGQNITIDFISRKLERLVGIEVQAADLNNFYTLGKTESCPIKIEFISFLKKNEILRYMKKLKRTSISIANDMTFKQREDSKILRKHLNLARQDNIVNCFINNNKLFVNNQIYSVKDLSGTGEFLDIEEKSASNSALDTPTPPEINRIEIPTYIKETLFADIVNKTKTSIPSPVSTASGFKQKKETEENTKIETRVTRNRTGPNSFLNKA